MVAQPMSTYGRISRDQRFTRRNPCPICEGGDGDKRGRGIRCWGFLSADEQYAICTNDAYAGALTKHPSTGGYMHRLSGPCNCGEDHSAGYHIEPLHKQPPTPATPPTRSHLARTPDAIYAYGEDLRFLRFGSGKGKTFVWQHADGAGGWLDGRGDAQPGLYRAEEVATADPWTPVFIPEGEKCVDALAALGQVATCNPDGAGAGKWGNVPNGREALRGRHVVILPDADEPGREHAAQIAADVAPVAASVRVLELDGAHDVADWLAAGHTAEELRRLAAATQNITACKPQTQETTPAPQDGFGSQTPKMDTCPNCQQWADRARIAETTVTNLRREKAMAERILALPNEKLAAPVKLAAIAVREVLSQPKARNEQGMEQIYRATISQRCGVSDQTAGAHLRKLADAGIIHREVVKTFDRSEIYISEGALFETPEGIEATGRSWGGHRVKRCSACGGENLEIRVTCRDCGTVLSVDDVNKPQTQETTPAPQDGFSLEMGEDGGEGADTGASDTQASAQDNSLPVDTIVDNLATDGDGERDGEPEPPTLTLLPTPPAPDPDPDRCPVTGGAHEYNDVRRTPDHRRACIECDRPEGS